MDEKKIIEIEIRNKKFKIEFISNWVVYKYSQLNEKLMQIQDLYKRLELLPAKDEIQKIVSDIKKLGSNLLDERLEIIEEVLTTNSIEFDRKWWERKTNAEDLAMFLNQCAFKDIIANKKKAKAN